MPKPDTSEIIMTTKMVMAEDGWYNGPTDEKLTPQFIHAWRGFCQKNGGKFTEVPDPYLQPKEFQERLLGTSPQPKTKTEGKKKMNQDEKNQSGTASPTPPAPAKTPTSTQPAAPAQQPPSPAPQPDVTSPNVHDASPEEVKKAETGQSGSSAAS